MKPYEFRRELLKQLAPEVDRIRNMSPDQQKVEELNMQNEYLQRQQESAQAQYQQQQTIKELELEIANVQEAHGISPEAFSEAFENLKDSGMKVRFSSNCSRFHIHMNAYNRSEDILSGVDESLTEDR